MKGLCRGLVVVVAGLVTLSAGAQEGGAKLRGEIKVDGSSTVYLITEAVATNFKKLHPGVNLTVGISGTGGGFKKFAAGETDLSDASRAIKPQEAENCKKNGIDFVELQVAWDGLAVVVNKENTWATKMTLAQLKKIWHPEAPAQKWSELDPGWPDEEIKLYGPGPDSGTFDFFTEAVNGKEKLSRTDYTASEDDNQLVTGVSRNKYALGYFGLAYYEAHAQKLTAVALQGKKGGFVEPDVKTVLDRSYPLSRPLFVYVRADALKREVVREFTRYYLRRADLVRAVKYVPLSALQQVRERKKLESAISGLGG